MHMKLHIEEDPLSDFWEGMKHEFNFVMGEPDHAARMNALAYAAYRFELVEAGTLADMLELVEAAELWALVEFEEADRLGLFDAYDPEAALDARGVLWPRAGKRL